MSFHHVGIVGIRMCGPWYSNGCNYKEYISILQILYVIFRLCFNMVKLTVMIVC